MLLSPKIIITTLLAIAFLTLGRPAVAMCLFGLFDCEAKAQATAYTAVKEEGTGQAKLITYTVKEVKKVESKNTGNNNEEINFLTRFFSGQEYKALLVTMVHLGADLNNIQLNDFTVSDCKLLESSCNITVQLPAIEVIATEIDEEKSSIISIKEGILVPNADTVAFTRQMFEQHKNLIAADALSNAENISKAKDQLMKILKDMIIKALGNSNVTFTS